MLLRAITTLALAGACLMAVPQPGHAQSDEPPREIGAGGLLYVNDPALVIVQYDVQISAQEISASYVIRNTGNGPRTVLFAFPLPDLDMAAIGEQAVAIPAPQSTNFVAATFSVDGTAVAVEIERRAVAFALDATKILEDLQVPLFPYAKGIGERLMKLAPVVRADLQQRGIARFDDGTGQPAWTLKTTAHWRQTFNAGQSLTINVTYRPIAAEVKFAPTLLEQLRTSHCIDAAIEANITRIVAARGGKVSFRWLSYALTSGGHLTGAIGAFRLLIVKPEIETVVATCRKNLRRPGPTTLEWSANDFHLDDDLQVLFVN